MIKASYVKKLNAVNKLFDYSRGSLCQSINSLTEYIHYINLNFIRVELPKYLRSPLVKSDMWRHCTASYNM